jgi:hypothetical protein
MAMQNADLQTLQEIKAKLQELCSLVEGSLNLQAVGGYHIANEILGLLPKIEALETAIQNDINEHAGP